MHVIPRALVATAALTVAAGLAAPATAHAAPLTDGSPVVQQRIQLPIEQEPMGGPTKTATTLNVKQEHYEVVFSGRVVRDLTSMESIDHPGKVTIFEVFPDGRKARVGFVLVGVDGHYELRHQFLETGKRTFEAHFQPKWIGDFDRSTSEHVTFKVKGRDIKW